MRTGRFYFYNLDSKSSEWGLPPHVVHPPVSAVAGGVSFPPLTPPGTKAPIEHSVSMVDLPTHQSPRDKEMKRTWNSINDSSESLSSLTLGADDAPTTAPGKDGGRRPSGGLFSRLPGWGSAKRPSTGLKGSASAASFGGVFTAAAAAAASPPGQSVQAWGHQSAVSADQAGTLVASFKTARGEMINTPVGLSSPPSSNSLSVCPSVLCAAKEGPQF